MGKGNSHQGIEFAFRIVEWSAGRYVGRQVSFPFPGGSDFVVTGRKYSWF